MPLAYWLLYNSVLALLPVPLVASYLWLTNAPISLARIVRDGQLFFYSASLSAAAVGDLVKPDGGHHFAPSDLALDVSALLVCVLLSCWFFGVSSTAGSINTRRLASISYIFTIGSTLLVAAIRWKLGLL